MSKVYTVNLNGYPVKEFSDELLAKRFMIDIQIDQQEKLKAFAYLDEAVLQSDLKESKEVLKHIMSL